MRCAACGGLAYEKPQSGLRPFVRFFSGTFFCALKPLRGFLIGRKKNVAYNRNDKYLWNSNSDASEYYSAGKKYRFGVQSTRRIDQSDSLPSGIAWSGYDVTF